MRILCLLLLTLTFVCAAPSQAPAADAASAKIVREPTADDGMPEPVENVAADNGEEIAGPFKKSLLEEEGVEKVGGGVMIRRYDTDPEEFKKRRTSAKRDMYPFTTPVVKYGDDIPICEAATKAETYASTKKQYKYVLHGKDGWLYRTVDFRTDFVIKPKSMEYFKRLNKIMKQKGETLIVFLQPPRAVMGARHIDPAVAPAGYDPAQGKAGYKAFIKQLNDNDILAVDLSDAPTEPEYFQKGDIHWNYEGAKWSAIKLAEMIKKLPAYDKLEKKNFVSEIISWEIPDRGTLEDLIQYVCQYNIEIISYPVWATTPDAESSDNASIEDSLLGDLSFPEITVVGTSNSYLDYKFNFVGMLKNLLKTDVYNAAIIGGGFGSSSFRYYASDEYQEHPPKVVVWEFLTQHNYNASDADSSFRQMIPALYGACDPKDAVATYDGEIKSTKVDFFDKLKNTPLKDTYLYLEATNPEGRSLQVEILYADGEADMINMSRNTRMTNNGKYYLEMPDNTPLFMNLITDKPEGNLHARLCRYPAQVVADNQAVK